MKRSPLTRVCLRMYSCGALMHVAVADLDIIPEDLIETHLEGFDACALFFNFFEVGNIIAGIFRGQDHFVQFS